MATQTYFLQNPANGGGNAYATVQGFPSAGAKIYSQPYNGGLAQQWIPAQYPGTDLDDTGGVVCVLYTADEAGLVMTASACKQGNTLQPFQAGNRYQLWAYPGVGGQGVWVNCATGCVLDLSNGDVDGGAIQTWSNVNNDNQQWALQKDTQAQVTANAAPALETASAD